MSAQIELVLGKLEGVKPAGSGRWMAKCPSHDDRQASLSIREGDDGRVLLNCHAGCTTETVVGDIEIGMEDLFPPRDAANGEKPRVVAEYDYRDEAGKLLYQAVRLSPKSFRQRRPAAAGGWDWKLEDTRRVLFRLPSVSSPSGEGRDRAWSNRGGEGRPRAGRSRVGRHDERRRSREMEGGIFRGTAWAAGCRAAR